MKPRREVDRLVTQNQKLVFKIAGRFAVGSTEFREDIEQAGMVGLVKAAQRFDPSTGYRFSSIAVPWIRGEILHFLRDRGGVPKVPSTWRDLYYKGYGLPDAEAAAKCKVSIEKWLEVKEACSTWLAEWDDRIDYGTEEEPIDEEEVSPELVAAIQKIRQWLEALPELEAKAIGEAFDGAKLGKQRKELAQQAISRLI